MKESTLKLLLVFLAVFCFAFSWAHTRSQLQTVQNKWIVVDTTTSAGNGPLDLAVNEMTYLTVVDAIIADSCDDGDISIYLIPQSYNSGRFRCLGISDNNAITYQIYLGTLDEGTDCELVKAGQLAFTIGTQVSTHTGYEFADAVTVTEYSWVKSWGSSSPGGDDVAEAALDLMGADLLVVAATTSDCNCMLLIKGF